MPVPKSDREPIDRVDQGHDDVLRLPGFDGRHGVLKELKGVTGKLRAGSAFLRAGAHQMFRGKACHEAVQLLAGAGQLMHR